MRGRELREMDARRAAPLLGLFFFAFPRRRPRATRCVAARGWPPSAWRECLPVLGHGKKTHPPPATAPQQHLAFFPSRAIHTPYFFSTSTPSPPLRNATPPPARTPPASPPPPAASWARWARPWTVCRGRGRDGGDVSFERGRERERERERELSHTRPRMPGEREREKTRGLPHTPLPSSLTAPKPSATGGGTWWPACGPGGRP